MDFKQDVLHGLRNKLKALPSRYFYDAKGDALFQRIMRLEEYYLPGCEKEIIENATENIADILYGRTSQWNVIELGAGDGSKTKALLKGFEQKGISVNYIPLDISSNVLQINRDNILGELPGISYEGVAGNYFRTFHTVKRKFSHNLILYLGSNIGNYTNERAVKFLQWLRKGMTDRDIALIAFDLKKQPHTILKAYNDSQGITRLFNLNLLERINRELNGDFIIDNFDHYPYYEPVSGTAYSYLVSLKDQIVTIDGESFHFDKYELIHTEISKKYDLTEIHTLSVAGGFDVKLHFHDRRKYYSLSIFTPHD